MNFFYILLVGYSMTLAPLASNAPPQPAPPFASIALPGQPPSTNFTSEPLPDSLQRELRRMLDTLLEVNGLRNFPMKLQESYILSIVSVYREEHSSYFLEYNRSFMQSMMEKSRVAAYIPLAHEMAHMLYGHDRLETPSVRDNELSADFYTGYCIYRLGKAPEAAMPAFSMMQEAETETFPGRATRIAAFREGYLKYCGE